MNYSEFLNMVPEAVLMAVLVIVFIADFVSTEMKERRWFNPLVCLLLLFQTLLCICPHFQNKSVEAFGGMYEAYPSVNVMKTILTAGTLIVAIQARKWLSRSDTRHREGEFYMLVISTLLGMYMMMSAGHFLMFFLGLEMASIPLACLVALDKYRHNSAEAAAKFILMAVFSSGVMLYGISFIYGTTGTLYFGDVATALWRHENVMMSVMGIVFFISGLGFKISLVPFHFWTADTYEGAPTTVTGYLSVISKGAAAFTLLAILLKVFAPLTGYWQTALYALIVLSITVANLFAIRQSELKRFMAFSSISQAGYIMLAAIGPDAAASVSALTYYVLVYIVANLAVFAVISVVEENNGGVTDMAAYNGFYSTNPKLTLLMTLALFSLAGIPPFAGMFSKFFVFMSAFDQGNKATWVVLFIALINTVISLYYYLLIVKAMYIRETESPLPKFRSDWGTRVALVVCTAGVVGFGVFSVFFEWICGAVQQAGN